eukprot:CAMPEP_0197535026 /NCGR_PEP_ID=MMETSP1318-20131121/49208_1 /TAXON_ID=552666 /ORGANISM="Partenskyella glossopodia, Strain RCC365" /LENGTH=473 /DNA_ID=CAMNT_0043092497 /DNA_START=164 /DNA_END=1585 /DNA_ORIENTATION=-
MIDDILAEKKAASHKEMILRDHRMKAYTDQITDSQKKLLEMYEDKSGSRTKELTTIAGPNVFSEFYSRLKATRDYHRKFPNASLKLDDSIPVPKINPNFTGEENYCKYVDMHDFYKRYTNMRVFDKCNYFSFLGKFHKLHLVKKDKKIGSREYQKYVQDLFTYMFEFFQKRHPLADAKDFQRQIEEDFEQKWATKEIEGWGDEQDAPAEDDEDAIEYAPIDLSKYDTWEALEPLGMECLKAELKRVGLKTGGRLQERCKRLFLLKGKTIDEVPNKYRAKKHVKTVVAKNIAKLEYNIKMFYELLRPQIEATREYIEKKLTKTYEEIQAEREQDSDEEVSESDDDNDKQLYNPLKLPLGWDGKPIPYWLYKLHGLNIEYKCEICGNYSYWGPRAFTRHFNEWRHSYGMKCLGITNTKDFENITLIEDAITLNRKLKKMKQDRAWKPEEEEEFEDKEGHVYNKKTYDDLKRQGLV